MGHREICYSYKTVYQLKNRIAVRQLGNSWKKWVTVRKMRYRYTKYDTGRKMCHSCTHRQRGFWDRGAGTPAGSQNSLAGTQNPGPRTPRCLCVYKFQYMSQIHFLLKKCGRLCRKQWILKFYRHMMLKCFMASQKKKMIFFERFISRLSQASSQWKIIFRRKRKK